MLISYMRPKRSGFSLVELLIVMSILIILIIMSVMIFDPIAQIGKAHDAQRKKDLKMIKASFEEYFNDMGCYPTNNIIDELSNKINCHSNSVFGSWLKPWPCDPLGNPYQFKIDPSNPACPKWFKALTKLEYEKDPEVPYKFQISVTGARAVSYNYGVSSTNVKWMDDESLCAKEYSGSWPRVQLCYEIAGGLCSHNDTGCVGPNCFANDDCNMECALTKCPE